MHVWVRPAGEGHALASDRLGPGPCVIAPENVAGALLQPHWLCSG